MRSKISFLAGLLALFPSFLMAEVDSYYTCQIDLDCLVYNHCATNDDVPTHLSVVVEHTGLENLGSFSIIDYRGPGNDVFFTGFANYFDLDDKPRLSVNWMTEDTANILMVNSDSSEWIQIKTSQSSRNNGVSYILLKADCNQTDGLN
jgi:hypothetical protein